MANTKAATSVGSGFAGVMDKQPAQLSPIERKARGIMKALTDSTLARDRAAAAAAHHTEQAEFYGAQVEELTAKLAAVEADAKAADDAAEALLANAE